MKSKKFVSVVGSVALIGSVGVLDAKVNSETQAQKDAKIYTKDKTSATNALKIEDYNPSSDTLTKDKKADKTDTGSLQADIANIKKYAGKVTADLKSMKTDEPSKTKFGTDELSFNNDLGKLKGFESDYTAKEKAIAKALKAEKAPSAPQTPTQKAEAQAATDNANLTTETADVAKAIKANTNATTDSVLNQDLKTLTTDTATEQKDLQTLKGAAASEQSKDLTTLQNDEAKVKSDTSALDTALTDSQYKGAVPALQTAQDQKSAYDNGTGATGSVTPTTPEGKAIKAAEGLKSSSSVVSGDLTSLGKAIGAVNTDSGDLQKAINSVTGTANSTQEKAINGDITALQGAEAQVVVDEKNLGYDANIAAAQQALSTLQDSVTSSTHTKAAATATSGSPATLTNPNLNSSWTTLGELTGAKGNTAIATTLTNAQSVKTDSAVQTDVQTLTQDEKSVKSALGALETALTPPASPKKGTAIVLATESAPAPKTPTTATLEQTFENDVTALQGAENTLSTAVGTAEVSGASSALSDLQAALSTGANAKNPLALESSVEAIKTAIEGLNTATTAISTDLTNISSTQSNSTNSQYFNEKGQNILVTNHYVQADLSAVKTDEASATNALDAVEKALTPAPKPASSIVLATDSNSALTTAEGKLTSAEKALTTSEQTLNQDITLAGDYNEIGKLVKQYSSSVDSLNTEFKKFSTSDASSVNNGVKTAYNALQTAINDIKDAFGSGNTSLSNAIATLKSYKNGETTADATKFSTQKTALNTQILNLQTAEKNFQQLVQNLETAQNNSIDVGSTNFTLGATDFTTSNTAQNLSNMQSNLTQLQTALNALNYTNDHAVMQALSNALAVVDTANTDLKNPQVNVSSLNNQMSDAKEALAGLENVINSAITTAGSNADEVTNLKSALSLVQNASAVVSQAKNNVIAVAAQNNIVPTITLPATHTQSVSGSAYGVDLQIGYKYFFGKTKHWGIRGYATYAYMQSNLGHTTNIMGAGNGVGQANNHTYGAGFDFLYNFHESQDGIHTAGILLGTELLGSTWVNQGESIWHSKMEEIKALGGSASMNTSYFQIPLVVGFRSNFSKHSGIELGLKIPLVVNYYFRSNYNGFEESTIYKNNIKLYFNYVVNF
ncbi:outer membrane protein [Helicobacter cetorum]|uniref:outer membrane protein n=1 Tax=Helicobacter cetorum TaxID=138563 RepID=UPI000CF0CDC3|nr:outer membrane beta-barrel protein [Helicobacter cetorum]